jgi:probable rRNA maturation factor
VAHFHVNVHVKNSQKDLKIKPQQIKRLVHSFLEFHQISYSEITIHLVTDKKMCRIHEDFFDDPSSTDCMTFPVDPIDTEDAVLGDIFVCPKVALEFDAPYKELSLYIIHGLLHILGYDDIDSEDRKRMRMAEKKEMTRLSKMKLLLEEF